MDSKTRILEFIKKEKLAIISTVSSGCEPQSAVLEFGQTEDLELIFDTFAHARKYKNLQQNQKVGFVIGWDENITVQYQGVASELTGDEKERYKRTYFAKNPDASRWENKEGIAYFKVTPTWIRYSDLTQDPWEVFEITF